MIINLYVRGGFRRPPLHVGLVSDARDSIEPRCINNNNYYQYYYFGAAVDLFLKKIKNYSNFIQFQF